MGSVDRVAVKIAAASIQTFFGLPVDVEDPVPMPDEALMTERGQYDAAALMGYVDSIAMGPDKRMGITSRDITLPFLTYLYGEAQVAGRVAVISTFRLKGDSPGFHPDRSLVYDRLAKVSVHETGHLLGLIHCRDPGCIMNFSPGLEHLDRLTIRFCTHCNGYLKEGGKLV